MPQFNTTGRNDVSGALSVAGGRKNAAYAMWKRRKNSAGPKGGMR